MAIRQDSEIDIQDVVYNIKQLPATRGWTYLLKLIKLIFSGASSLSEILQHPDLQDLLSSFSDNSFHMTEEVLKKLPPEMGKKLTPLKGQVYESVKVLQDALQPLLTPEEFSSHYLKISLNAAQGNQESLSKIQIAQHLLKFVGGIMQDLEPEEIGAQIEFLINHSVTRYKTGDAWENWRVIGGQEEFSTFDEYFAGRYNEMLELFVYLLVYNYGESIALLKKNQITTHLQPILQKIMPSLAKQ